MTRHGLFTHMAASLQRRPTGWLAPRAVEITLSLENSLGGTAKIYAITTASAFFNARDHVNAAVIDYPRPTLKHKIP